MIVFEHKGHNAISQMITQARFHFANNTFSFTFVPCFGSLIKIKNINAEVNLLNEHNRFHYVCSCVKKEI